MRFEQAIAPARRAAERLRRAQALRPLSDVLPFLHLALVCVGRFREADEVSAEIEPLAERLGHSAAAALMRRANVLRVAAEAADLSTLSALALAQFRMAQATGSRFWLATTSVTGGLISFWRGEWATASEQLREAARLAIPGFGFGSHHGALCMLLAFQGRGIDAWAVLDQARDSLPHPGEVNTTGQWNLAVFGAEAAGVLMDSDWARQLHSLVVEALATGTLLSTNSASLLQRAAGMAAAAAGLHDLAEQHFEGALRQAQELPHLMERPMVRHFYARYLLGRGGRDDRARALTFLDEAAAGYRSIGMPRHLAMVEALLATAPAG